MKCERKENLLSSASRRCSFSVSVSRSALRPSQSCCKHEHRCCRAAQSAEGAERANGYHSHRIKGVHRHTNMDAYPAARWQRSAAAA